LKKPSSEIALLIVRAYHGERTNYDREEYYLDQYSTELLHDESFTSETNGDKIAVLNYDLYIKSIDGLPTKIIAFL
jgi:hypothetical protein